MIYGRSSQFSNVQSISMCSGQELAKTNKAVELYCFVSLPSATPILAFACLYIVHSNTFKGIKQQIKSLAGNWSSRHYIAMILPNVY